MENKRLPIIGILLILAIANFSRMKGFENIRTVDFLSILVIGALSGILLVTLITKFKNRN